MADFSAVKSKKNLGAPPTAAETSGIIDAPETAPAAGDVAGTLPARGEGGASVVQLTPARDFDGRSARRTGRTVQFSTRVSAEFDRKFRQACKRDKLLMVELLEQALAAYEKEHG